MNSTLSSYTRNITSQYGEDGVIAEIFQRIGTRSKCCVEFGAWDGKYLSNTWALWYEQGWSAILIEGEKDRHASLEADLAEFTSVRAVCAFVRPEGDQSLDAILSREGAPKDIDLLSIDVDGDEYHIWNSLTQFRPRVVIAEHNPTIPPELDLVQKPGEYFGTSAGALTRLAHSKGYKLAACTDTNSIFVTDEDFPKLGILEPDVRVAFPRHGLSYLLNSYDGKIFMSQNPVYSKPLPEVCAAKLLSDLREELFPKERRPPLPVDISEEIVPVTVAVLSRTDNRTNIVTRLGARFQTLFEKLPPVILWRRLQAYRAEVARKAEVVRRWRASGCPIPTPHEVKQEVLNTYARRHHLATLVETGTYLGDMVEAMRRRFRRIYSIELGEELWQKARDRFAAIPKITILQGDSATVLGRIMEELRSPALFWLDGHYSAGITAKGELETPIFAELDHIFEHRIKNHVILIDDARCFDGTNDYPTIDTLRGYILKRRPNAKIEIADDIIRITL